MGLKDASAEELEETVRDEKDTAPNKLNDLVKKHGCHGLQSGNLRN